MKFAVGVILVSQVLCNVYDLNEGNFSTTVWDGEKTVGNKGWFVKFYAPWCGHCQRLAPTWVEYGVEQYIVNVGQVDCTTELKICSDFGVSGYPTLIFFPAHEDFRHENFTFSGNRTIEDFDKFAK